MGVIWALCIAGRFVCPVFVACSERVTNNGKGLCSICSGQLSKMWLGYGGTVCSLVIMFCLRCAQNDSAILMVAEGNDSHVSGVLPV